MAMTIEEAVRKKFVRLGDYIDYQPIIKPEPLVLTRDKTGYDEDQTFGEAEKLHWTLEEFKGILLAVSDKPTSTKIGLGEGVRKRGKELWQQSLNEFCAYHYTDPIMAGEVVAMTEDMVNVIPDRIDLDRVSYWLGSTYEKIFASYAHFGMRYVYGVYVYCGCLFDSYGFGRTYSLGVRPVGYLKSKILLEENFERKGDGSKDNPWKPMRSNDDTINTAIINILGKKSPEYAKLFRQYVKMRKMLYNSK